MTTATTTLADWLLERLAEDEAVARAATPGQWFTDDDYGTVTAEPFTSARAAYSRDYDAQDVDCWVIPESRDSGVDTHNRDHIARHDPARVLREVAAKRAIVKALIVPYIAERRRLMGGQPSWSDEHPDLLLHLASVYVGAPGWREEWAL